MSRLEGGAGKWCPPAPLFLENSPNDPSPSSLCSDYKTLQNLTPLVFKTRCYGDSSSLCKFLMPGMPGMRVCFIPLFTLHSPSLQWTIPWVPLAPIHVSGLPTIFDVASSLHLTVESLFCQSLHPFLGYLH